MKKAAVFILIGLIVGAALMYLLGPVRFPNRTKPAEPTSFSAVTAELDAGGDLYAYLDTKRPVRAVEGWLAEFAKTLPPRADEKEAAAVSFVFRLLNRSGLNELSGLGLSNVVLPSGWNRTRMVLHRDPARSEGFLWQLADPGPRKLSELDLLPADTALAAFNEYRLDRLWARAKQELEASGVPEAAGFARQAEPALLALGVDLPKVLASLTGSIGYLVTLDAERTISIPGGEAPKTIPEPGLAVVIGTRDATLFDLVRAKLPMAAASEKDGRRTLQLPSIPAPLPLEPCLVAEGGVLVAASTPRLAEAVLRSRAKKDGLAGTDGFKDLARHVPARGNGFTYVSPRLWPVYLEFLKNSGGEKPEGKKAQDALLSLFPRDLAAFGVMENRADGIVWTAGHNLNPETMILMPLASMAGLAAATGAPAFARTGDEAKANQTLALLKTAGVALDMYLADAGEVPAADSMAGLQGILVPAYIKEWPLKDGWGHDLLYRKVGADGYLLASPGKDGRFEGWEQKGEYPRGEVDRDVILSSGRFVYGPGTE